MTALHWSIAKHRTSSDEIVKLLLAHGANVNLKDVKHEWTALHWAVNREHVCIVQMLVNNRADVNQKDKQEQTPVDIAKRKGEQYIQCNKN